MKLKDKTKDYLKWSLFKMIIYFSLIYANAAQGPQFLVFQYLRLFH